MAKKIIKYTLLLLYLLIALLLLALHGYFIYNSQQFPLTNYYWWLLAPVLVLMFSKLKISSQSTFLFGLAILLLGAIVRIFSTTGETLLNGGFVVIILSLFRPYLDLMIKKISLIIYFLLFIGIGEALINSHQGIAQKLTLVLYVYLIIYFILHGKDS